MAWEETEGLEMVCRPDLVVGGPVRANFLVQPPSEAVSILLPELWHPGSKFEQVIHFEAVSKPEIFSHGD